MQFDLIVIGSGPAGQWSALQGVKLGRKVALIEEMPLLGGGCAHYGTLPSKSFRESVYRWSLSSRGSLGAGEVKETGALLPSQPVAIPDMARLLRRRDRVVESEAEVIQAQLKRNKVHVIHGRAKIIGPNEVQIGAKTFKTSIIVIATGSHPGAPSHAPVDGKTILDSNTILTLKKVPKSLVVLGAGVIGCEYASMFATAGSKVYLVDKRNEILAIVDREIVKHLTERFEQQKMEILLKTEAEKIEHVGDRVRVHLSNGKKILVDAVLVASGRQGNTQGLGLESVGIKTDSRGLVPVDPHFRTSVPNIYAVGDVVGFPALAATSMEQGRIAVRHAFENDRMKMPSFYPYGIYTIPEISTLGANEEELKEKKADFVVGRAYYREIARGQIIGDRWGLLKLLVDRKSGKLLGVHIMGDAAANLIHIGQAVMALGGDVTYFIDHVFNYPTLAEAYKTAAFRALNKMKGHQAARDLIG